MTRPAYTTDPLSRPAQTVWQAERRRGPIAPYSHRIHAALFNPAVSDGERSRSWIALWLCVGLPIAGYIFWSIWS